MKLLPGFLLLGVLLGAPKPFSSDGWRHDAAFSEKMNSRAAIGTANFEVIAKDLTVAAGDTRSVTSSLDFQGADKIAVGVVAPQSSTLHDVFFTCAWGLITESGSIGGRVVQGSTFDYFNSGGFTTDVYSPRFGLVIANKGDSAVTIRAITVYAAGKQ